MIANLPDSTLTGSPVLAQAAPSLLDSILRQADTHYAREDWLAARDCLRQAIEVAPRHPQFHCALGSLHFRLKDHPEARAAFTAALCVTPDNPDLLTQMAMTLLELNKPSEAEAALRQALALRPGHPTARQLLGNLKRDVPASVGEMKGHIDLVANLRYELSDLMCQATGSPFGIDSLANGAAETPAPIASPPNLAVVQSAEAVNRVFGQIFNEADVFEAARHRAALRAAIREEVTEPQWARNLTSLIDSYNSTEINELAAVLGQTEDRDRIESTLVHLQVKRIQQGIDPAKKTVAIYFPTAAYREHLGTIPDQLRERGYNVVTIVGMVCDDKCERQANVFYGGHCGQTEIVNQLDFVDLFVTPVLATGLPERARKAYILHDIHDSPLGDEATTQGISEKLREFDFVFTPSEPSVELFRKVVPLARQPGDKPITLIKAGYPKLDRLTRYFEEHGQDTPTLIYAPTVFGYGFDEIVSVVSHGDAIIDSILRRIPDHKLIFRPHPHTLQTPVVQALAAKYREHPNFIFDDNASSYMENYSQAALMISDISGTAFTYAFATLRPVIFFSPNEEIVQQKYAGLSYAADRSRIGCVVTHVIELVDKINLLLRHRDKQQEAVRLCRDQTIFNVNRSEAAFIEHLECVLDGRKQSGWIELGSDEA